MQTDLLCQVAALRHLCHRQALHLSAAGALHQRAQPGMRVMIPFGAGNRRVEGLILDLIPGERKRSQSRHDAAG